MHVRDVQIVGHHQIVDDRLQHFIDISGRCQSDQSSVNAPERFLRLSAPRLAARLSARHPGYLALILYAFWRIDQNLCEFIVLSQPTQVVSPQPSLRLEMQG